MEVVVTNQDDVPNLTGNGYFDVEDNSTVMSVFGTVAGSAMNSGPFSFDNAGLVTEFTPVPLPAALPLLIGALTGLGALAHWRKGRASQQA